MREFRRFRGRTPLLVYTMGKVGSSSVIHSLRLMELGRPLYHLHSLDPKPLQELEDSFELTFPDSLNNLRHIWHSQFMAKRLAENPDARVQAISLIRDPIARNMSNFFQHIEVKPHPGTSQGQHWKLASIYFGFEITASEEDVSELIELYFDKEWHDFPAHWIEREVNGVLGINVYATPFPRQKGYAIYHSRRADLLMFRLRDLNHCAARAFQEFLGLDTFTLVNANVGEKKAYADVYRAFKAQIAFPEAFLDRTYNSKFVKYFYSEAEREELRKKWGQS
jgi:hypothetical protein